jgi:hypothetical protein
MGNAMTDKEDWVDIGSAEELARTLFADVTDMC